MLQANSSVLNEYQALNNKFRRKRILKIPNIAEAGESFESLAIRSEGSGDLHTSALCYRAAAKCFTSLGHQKHSAELLTKAARHFMECELTMKKDGLVSTGESLQAAIHCYHEARERYGEVDSLMAGALSLEVGNKLVVMERQSAALVELQKAALWLRRAPIQRVQCQRSIINLLIHTGEMEEALKTCQDGLEEVKNLPPSSHRESLVSELQVIRILLVLIVQPVPTQVPNADLEVLERLTWASSVGEDEDALDSVARQLSLKADMLLWLQSVVMATQSRDVSNLTQLEDHMLPHLTCLQANLMRHLVKTLSSLNISNSV